VAIVAAVRAAFPDLVVSVDANGAYDLARREDYTALRELDEYGLAALEQPLNADDLLGHARLVRELKTTVVLDESIPTSGALDVALALGACDGVSVKLARLGGIGAAVRVHDRCLAAGVHLTIGGMLESGIGRAAAIALGALAGFDLPGDLGASDRYFAPDLTAPHLLVEGELAVPVGPGLGVELDDAAIAAARVRSQHFSRS
jgi:O-succinylbenzoate synthase